MPVAVIALVMALILVVTSSYAEDANPPALAQPLPAASAPPVEETPGFQAIRPETETIPPQAPAPVAAPVVAPAPVTAPAPVVQIPPAPPASPAPPAPPASSFAIPEPSDLLVWLLGAVMLALGAAIAGWTGTLLARHLHTLDEGKRRRAAQAMLVAELEARRQAFESVPVPPNAEAGVSFVSAVTALADMNEGWKAAQPALHLLGERMAAHLSVHYGAVGYVANFVKGQSLAAALRMLQGNRLGGHPCPDAAAMREAHVELAAAFRGVDKIIQGLKG